MEWIQRSAATVPTGRPARYGKQLTEHLGHKRPAVWHRDEERGTVTFDGAEVQLVAATDRLDLTVCMAGDDIAELERIEHVVGVHLVRFGIRDELAVEWRRCDGTAGTTQR